MQVLLLGTGSADGWPNPFCQCASCAGARRDGSTRGQTSALVDDRLLLDCGPEAPRAAARAGRSLSGVTDILLTHDHPDHSAPMALLTRSWARCRDPLRVSGPAESVQRWQQWVGPHDPVTFQPVRAGDRFDAGGYRIRVLEAAHRGQHGEPGVLYDVTGPDGARLLYATDTGPLTPECVAMTSGAAYDLLLLEETFGEVRDHGTDHLDLWTFPAQLARLREVGALTGSTDVVAVHLSHRNPPAHRLAQRLGEWRARVVDDLTLLDVGGSVRDVPADVPADVPRSFAPLAGGDSGPHRTLVLGGARSGKSARAEHLLADAPGVTYLATGPVAGPQDAEWGTRVAAHRARRPQAWETVESTDLVAALGQVSGPLLVDCLSLWLSAVLERHGAWAEAGTKAGTEARPDGHPSWTTAVEAEIDELVAAWRAVRCPVVAVSNEVGAGVVPPTLAGRVFRDTLGRLNQRIASESERVLLVVAGRTLDLSDEMARTR